MSIKTVELSVLLSLINGYDVLNVTEEEKIEVVGHIHGVPIEQINDQSFFESAVEYMVNKYPVLANAAAMVVHLPPDQGRYNKLIDLTKKWFHIEPMQAT